MKQPVYMPDFRRPVILLNGQPALIRPINHEDSSGLKAFFGRLGSETKLLRFQYNKASISDQELSGYCDCDHIATLCLVAERERLGAADIVGVARYDRFPDAHSAEVAFVVEDAEQGNGIGTHLLAQLAALGRTRGIDTFIAETLTYNEIMLSIFRKFDPRLKRSVDGDSCRVTFTVAQSCDRITGQAAPRLSA
jgi:RimJ/RimL family protein N-acetyltransferase